MSTLHVYPEKLYVITNQVVARTEIFNQRYYCKRFLEGMDKYLSPLCKIIAYSFGPQEFRMVIKLNESKAFKSYYKQKRNSQGRSAKKTPHSSYIFSQAMANLQSSTAIHFNRKEGRSGALFAKRFEKIRIDGEWDLNKWIEDIHERKKIHRYKPRWGVASKLRSRDKKIRDMDFVFGSGVFYGNGSNGNGSNGNGSNGNGSLSCFKKLNNNMLQGQFKTLPSLTISRPELLTFLEIRHNIKIE